MDQEPELGPEPLDPPTREEEEAEAWEYWHQRAINIEHELAETKGQLSIVRCQRDTVTMAFNSYLRGHGQAEVRDALAKLSNEVLGSLPLMEALCRREFGNTNYNALIQRAEEARAIIAKATGAQP
jgi:hypothetical protein